MASTGIDFGLNGIGYQLKSRLLGVPLYQRSYAWEKDQLLDFCSEQPGPRSSRAPSSA